MENTRVSNKIHHKDVPVDVILSLLMIGRVYLVGRYMVLHSKQFQVFAFVDTVKNSLLFFFGTA